MEWSFNCYPVILVRFPLDWGSNDTIEEFTVDFDMITGHTDRILQIIVNKYII